MHRLASLFSLLVLATVGQDCEAPVNLLQSSYVLEHRLNLTQASLSLEPPPLSIWHGPLGLLAIGLAAALVVALALVIWRNWPQEEEKVEEMEPFALKWYHWLIFYSMIVISFGVQTMYVPNMPSIVKELNTTPQMLQLTLQVNVLVHGFGGLVIGRVSDLCGRRRTMLSIMSLLLVGTLISANSHTVQLLILGRVIQALGETSIVVVQAIILEYVPSKEARAFTFATLALAAVVTASAAPFLGGLVGSTLGWRAIFYFQAVAGVLLILGAFFLIPRSIDVRLVTFDQVEEDKKCWATFQRYRVSVMVLLVMNSLMDSQIQAMSSTFPYILQDNLGMSEMGSSCILGAFAMAALFGVGLVVLTQGVDLAIRAKAGLAILFSAAVGYAVLACTWQSVPLAVLSLPQIVYNFGVCSAESTWKAILYEPFGGKSSGTVSGLLAMVGAVLAVLNTGAALRVMVANGPAALFIYFASIIASVIALFFLTFRGEVPIMKKLDSESEPIESKAADKWAGTKADSEESVSQCQPA